MAMSGDVLGKIISSAVLQAIANVPTASQSAPVIWDAIGTAIANSVINYLTTNATVVISAVPVTGVCVVSTLGVPAPLAGATATGTGTLL